MSAQTGSASRSASRTGIIAAIVAGVSIGGIAALVANRIDSPTPTVTIGTFEEAQIPVTDSAGNIVDMIDLSPEAQQCLAEHLANLDPADSGYADRYVQAVAEHLSVCT